MTNARRVVNGHAWMVNRSCTQRQFLLRPDDATANAYLYCAIEAAQRTGVQLVVAQMMSNHTHEVVFPREGTVVDFYARFHTHLAKCMNHLRGRWENVWAAEPTCAVEAMNPEDFVRQLVYVATNPVKDGLVDAVHHWPGPRVVDALLNQRVLRATRPAFFRDGGDMPEVVELLPSIPTELGDPDEILAALRHQIGALEAACARDRLATGQPVVGRRRILRQSWRESPSSPAPRGTLRPRIAAQSVEARVAALLRYRLFLLEYRDARQRWLRGERVIFPLGTFWLMRYAHVPTRAAPAVTHIN